MWSIEDVVDSIRRSGGIYRYAMMEWFDPTFKDALIPPPHLPMHVVADHYQGKVTIPGGTYDIRSFIETAKHIEEHHNALRGRFP